MKTKRPRLRAVGLMMALLLAVGAWAMTSACGAMGASVEGD